MRTSSYYGHPTCRFETSSYRLTEARYAPRAELPEHSHDHAHFCLVLSGSYVERLDGRRVCRQPGDLIYYAPGVVHAERHRAAGKHFMIDLAPELARGLPAGAVTWSAPHGSGRRLATRIFAALRGGSPSPERIDALIERLLARLEGPDALEEIPPWLAAVERSLRQAPDVDLDLDRLARRAGVHRVSLGRAFKRVYGSTPGQYLRRLRVECALSGLAGGEGLAGVAHDTGFCDQSHLNRVFKRETGATPGQYRRWIAADGG